jgi:hypothetical protein
VNHAERGPGGDAADQQRPDVLTPQDAPDERDPGAEAQRHFSPRLMVRGLAWDVGLPLVAYYALHLLGASDWVALLTASLAAGLRIVWAAVRDRRLNLFAVVMLVVFAVGLALAFVEGDPRFLLLKDSFVTGAVGLTFAVTTLFDRPLTLAAMQSFTPAKAEFLAERYRTDARVRRGYRLSSWVWGVGLLLEAALRVPLVFLLPVSVMVAVSQVMMIAAFALLIAWTSWYSRRAALRAG